MRLIAALMKRAESDPVSCSFCGKYPQEVKGFIAGPEEKGVYICNECVSLCRDLLWKRKPPAIMDVHELRRIEERSQEAMARSEAGAADLLPLLLDLARNAIPALLREVRRLREAL